MKSQSKGRRKTSAKGVAKTSPDVDNPEKNPLLHIENKRDFAIETDNLLENPDSLAYKFYDGFDIVQDDSTGKKRATFDFEKLNGDSKIVVILRYYEYLCIAEMRFSYIMPMLKSGLNAADVFAMICHSLKNKLLMNVPSFETVFEPDIRYVYKVLYYETKEA